MTGVGLSSRIKDQYDDYYVTEDARWRRLGALDKAANVAALCSGLSVESFVEIGAGDGSLIQRLAEIGFGARRYALEISSSAVAAIREKQIPGLQECLLFDGYRIPYEDQSFDLAVLSHVVEHLEHPRQLLYEAARVARHVFVEVPLEDTMRLSANHPFDHVGHINFYSRKTIRLLLRSCGLNVLREHISNPSKATYVYASGGTGVLNYGIKEALLRTVPSVATKLFCYHGSYLCAR